LKKIGIIGTGQSVAISHYHNLGIVKDGRAKVAAVFDVNKQFAENWVRERNLDAVVCSSMEEMYDIVDAVDICTPNFCHYDYMMDAIKHNKSFFVEKPPALCAGQVQEALNQFDGKNVNMVGFIYRHCDLIRQLKKYAQNYLGRVYSFTAYYGNRRLANEENPIEWRFLRKLSGSGALGDFMSHVIDVADFALGIRLDEVACHKNTFITTRPADKNGNTTVENDDAAVVTAIGKKGELFSGTVSRVGMDDMTIMATGEGGMISVSIRNPEVLLLWKRNHGEVCPNTPEVIALPHQDHFTGWFESEMSQFISALYGEDDTYANLHQGLYVMDVIDKMDLSADEKRIIKI